MASRFWVGGTGTWDNSTTTHWAATSGGAGGQSVPGSSDTVTFDASSGGGTVTPNYNMTVTSITMGAFTGTLDFSANNNSPTMGTFSGAGTGTRTLNMGSGTWNLTTVGTTWDMSTTTNLTFNAGTSTIKIAMAGAGQSNFSGGGLTYGTLWFSRPSIGIVAIIGGDNTFSVLKDDGIQAHSLLFRSGTTQTVGTFSVSGSAGVLIRISSCDAAGSENTSTHTLSKASGSVGSAYLDIQHSIAGGGAVWNAALSTNNQATASAGSGWNFSVSSGALSNVSTMTNLSTITF